MEVSTNVLCEVENVSGQVSSKVGNWLVRRGDEACRLRSNEEGTTRRAPGRTCLYAAASLCNLTVRDHMRIPGLTSSRDSSRLEDPCCMPCVRIMLVSATNRPACR